MSVEISPLGGLSLLALLGAVLLGASVHLSGFQAGLNLGASSFVWFSPIVEARLTVPSFLGGALTLGSTIIYMPNDHYGGIYATSSMRKYELEHVKNWAHFGLGYALKVLAEPCLYDPRGPWSCDSDHLLSFPRPPNYGGLIIRWGEP